MHILISNDDGYLAPGLKALTDSLRSVAQLTVVAPDRDRSGASGSLTLTRPLRAEAINDELVRVDGTPTDCIHLALTGLMDEEPDMVVTGINSGANMGDDVLYSGTVSAAMEGRFLGYPALAFSMNSYNPDHWETAARVALELVQRLIARPLPSDTILNINVPDVAYDDLRGIRTTRLGQRHKAEPVVKSADPRGAPIYWVGPAGAEQDAGEGTDFHAVREGYVSVTPLKIDLTDHASLPTVDAWLAGEGA
jgi:5'-nucleotidase